MCAAADEHDRTLRRPESPIQVRETPSVFHYAAHRDEKTVKFWSFLTLYRSGQIPIRESLRRVVQRGARDRS
jgi:hypothetical protein